MIDLLTLLGEIYREISGKEVEASLSELKKALKLLNGGPLTSQFPHIWFAITKLASAYSADEKFVLAEVLFSYSIPSLEALGDILYGTKKSNAFLNYSLHLQPQQDWAKSARMLTLALESVTQMGDQGMIPKDDYEPLLRQVYARWNELLQDLKGQKVDEDLIKPMKGQIESKRPQLDHQQQGLEVAVNEMSSLEITRGASIGRLPTLTEAAKRMESLNR